MRGKLIAAGVKNLKEFGYPKCDKQNILTDLLYKQFFISMLKDSRGNGREYDVAIDELLAELEPPK
jgi:hypothetical protein